MDLAKDAVKISLKSIQSPPEIWLDPKRKVRSKILKRNDILRRQVVLSDKEIPLFEYQSKNSYSLITTRRVISYRNAVYNEIDLINVFTSRKLMKLPLTQKQSPLKVLRIVDIENQEFLIEFDEGYPAYFAMVLIDNLSTQLRLGRWSLNPSGVGN